MDARRTGTHSDLFQSCAEGPLLTDDSTATCSWSCKSKTGQNPAGKDTPRRESSIAKVYQSHFHIRSTIHFFFACQTHAQAYFPKVVAQGDTLFSAKHVLSYITQPPRSTPNPPSFLPSTIRGFSKINSSHPTSWTPASYLLNSTNKNKMNIFSSSFYFAPPATFTRICSCQLCFVNSCSRGCSWISFRVHSRLCCRFVSFT